MPMLQVNLLKGYTPEIKHRLMRSLTAVVRGITQATPDAITIWIHEVGSDEYSRGGEPRQPGVGAADPADLVSDYLSAMEARDLLRAQTYLSADFVMSFPGSGELTSLEQLVDWSGGRYRYVKKTIAGTDVMYGMDVTVVTTHGTLAGEWPDGSAFSGVRFIDRFELKAGLLIRQDVWNDLAIAHGQAPRQG